MDRPRGPPADNYPDGALFYPPLDVNGAVVVQAGKTVYISSDCGTNWTTVALPAAAGFASALAVATSSRIYVGTENGRIYRIDLAGGSWSAPCLLGRPASGYVSDLLADPTQSKSALGDLLQSRCRRHGRPRLPFGQRGRELAGRRRGICRASP